MYIVPKQKWRYPMAIEREYAKDLVRYVEAEMKIVESLLPEMVEAVWRNRLQKDSFNNDGLGDWLGSLVKKVENKIAKVLSPVKAIEKTFTKVAKHVKEQFGGIFKSVFGAKPKAAKGEAVKLETMKNLWVNENLDLIKSVDRNVLDSVRRTLTEKVVAAADKNILMSDLTAEIEHLTGVSRTRAALIGADQVGKLHGRLAQQKQMDAGIERYIWVTRGDRRVRPAHRVRHGVSYRWDSPPSGGHPGKAIRCRCVAQALIDVPVFSLTPQPDSFTPLNKNGIIAININGIGEAHIPIDKVYRYALDPNGNGKDKAEAFRRALGYRQTDSYELIKNVEAHINEYAIKQRDENNFSITMTLQGRNGKKAQVKTAWYRDEEKNEIRMSSVYVDKKKGGRQ